MYYGNYGNVPCTMVTMECTMSYGNYRQECTYHALTCLLPLLSRYVPWALVLYTQTSLEGKPSGYLYKSEINDAIKILSGWFNTIYFYGIF